MVTDAWTLYCILSVDLDLGQKQHGLEFLTACHIAAAFEKNTKTWKYEIYISGSDIILLKLMSHISTL